MPVANKHYQPDCEIYIHAWNRGHHPPGELADKRRHIVAPVGRRGAFGHPTVQPDAVMDKIVRNLAPGSLCDPFMRTGSTGVAAEETGRKLVGIEPTHAPFATACQPPPRAQT